MGLWVCVSPTRPAKLSKVRKDMKTGIARTTDSLKHRPWLPISQMGSMTRESVIPHGSAPSSPHACRTWRARQVGSTSLCIWLGQTKILGGLRSQFSLTRERGLDEARVGKLASPRTSPASLTDMAQIVTSHRLTSINVQRTEAVEAILTSQSDKSRAMHIALPLH